MAELCGSEPQKGTAHFEIHPDMAWKLNCVLASMHPMAIPAEFRQKPKQTKDFVMMERRFAVRGGESLPKC